jgi:hypothetical protein
LVPVFTAGSLLEGERKSQEEAPRWLRAGSPVRNIQSCEKQDILFPITLCNYRNAADLTGRASPAQRLVQGGA